MRIDALAILLSASMSASVLAAPPASGQSNQQQEAVSLPQFMAPEAQERLARRDRQSGQAANDTRRAAEALSAKFSGDFGGPHLEAQATADPPETTASISVVPEADYASPGRAAILRSSGSSAVGSKAKPLPDKPKRRARMPSRAAAPQDESSSDQRTNGSRRSRGARKPPIDDRRTADAADETTVPGAATGWQTGLIGMLTNPAFWH